MLGFSLRHVTFQNPRMVMDLVTTTVLGAVFGAAVSDDPMLGALLGALAGCISAIVYDSFFNAMLGTR